jgi:DNA mismatch repair protein MutS2
VIPVKSGNQHDVKGLIHDASQSKQTVFMEPDEVIPLNNRLREVQIAIQEEIARILMELSQYLARFQTAFQNSDEVALETEVIFAKARLNKKLSGMEIRFSSGCKIVLRDLRHPLLLLQGVNVVPNTVTMDNEKRILLLSGPNAGGKTVLLKSIALAAQMSRCGFPVPVAADSEVPFFHRLDPIIGDLQSVGENLSSFSSHISRLNGALKLLGADSLILVDEICGATDPEEGAALARSFINHFLRNQTFAVITSHLGPLKEKWDAQSQVQHGSLEFDPHTNKPTYQLLQGVPGRSLALSVAERYGVPPTVLEEARSYLSPVSQTRARELEEIEKFKSQILELKAQTQSDRESALKMKQQYHDLVQKFREQRDRWLERALEKAEKKIETLIEDARQQRLRDKTLHDIKSDLPEIIKARPGQQRIQTLEEFRSQFRPGTAAYSTRLGRMVIVQSEPDSKGQVMVLADSMRIQVPWHGLTSRKEEPAPQPTIRRSSAASQTAVGDDEAAELDLRGQRVDDAVKHLEKWLDNCIRQQRDRVKIIHGFGTEQLKKSVRQYLSKSEYVAKWSAGDSSTGGDGVTWVTLAD